MFRLRTVVDPVRPPACVRDHMTARQVIQPTYCSSSQFATRELYHVGSNGASIRHCPSTHSAKFKENYSPQQRARPLSPPADPCRPHYGDPQGRYSRARPKPPNSVPCLNATASGPTAAQNFSIPETVQTGRCPHARLQVAVTRLLP